MQSQTIGVQFDPKSLPRWAQKDKDVVALCESNLAFRVNVFDTTTAQMKRVLKREAARASENQQICLNCEGTGKLDYNLEAICFDCNGTGVIS